MIVCEIEIAKRIVEWVENDAAAFRLLLLFFNLIKSNRTSLNIEKYIRYLTCDAFL